MDEDDVYDEQKNDHHFDLLIFNTLLLVIEEF